MTVEPSNQCPQSQSLLEAMLRGPAELVHAAVELSLDVVDIFGVSGPSVASASGTSRHFRRDRST